MLLWLDNAASTRKRPNENLRAALEEYLQGKDRAGKAVPFRPTPAAPPPLVVHLGTSVPLAPDRRHPQGQPAQVQAFRRIAGAPEAGGTWADAVRRTAAAALASADQVGAR